MSEDGDNRIWTNMVKANIFIKTYIGILLAFALEDLICFGIGKSGLNLFIAIPTILFIALAFTYLLKK